MSDTSSDEFDTPRASPPPADGQFKDAAGVREVADVLDEPGKHAKSPSSGSNEAV